ncbi:MAG: hypothetical protein EOP22_01005 [Hyphomicrobiales bacterium]|nr:MAG: hypothetical protein EOP22_01005 [Hyphomicrobiales bacterium]
MFRSTSVLAILVAMSAPALAADYNEWGEFEDAAPDFRNSYSIEPKDWTELGDATDPMTFEIGARYWYSMGSASFSSLTGGLSSTDETHFGELHLRVNDHVTNTFAKANVGYSIASSGSYTSTGPVGDFSDAITSGHIGYAGADLGWNIIGDNNGSGAGVLVGYQYWNDALHTGRNNFTTLSGGETLTYTPDGHYVIPGDSAPNDVTIHALRLGVQGKAKLGDFFDIQAEVAAVPYASVSGTVGVDDPTFSTAEYVGPAQFPYGGMNGNISSMRASPTTIEGWGYGAQAEAWLGMHPTENLTFRLGGRASYLQGTADATYTRVFITDPGPPGGPYTDDPVVTSTGVIETANPFAMIRYGLMGEFTYSF